MRGILNWRLAVLATLFSSSVVFGGDGGAIDSSWLAKIRKGVKAVYEKYEDLSTRLEEESESRADKLPGAVRTRPNIPNTSRDRFVRLGDNMIQERVLLLDSRPKRPQIRLECDNKDYYFTLGKSQEDAPYALVEYVLGRRKTPLIRRGAGLHTETFSYLQQILAAINNDSKYALRALRFDRGKELLFIEFIHTPKETPIQHQIYIDPSHDWRVAEERVESSALAATEQWSYGVTIEGLEFPTRSKTVTMYKVANAPPNFEVTVRLISLKITDKKPEDFRLSAFDLPEPIDAPALPRPTPWYLWILAGAIASGVLAMLMACLKSRHAKTKMLTSKAS